MKKHPNKHIREAVDYALECGWRLVIASGHAHNWGHLFCPRAQRDGCRIGVYSTPRNPENHARRIHEAVDGCTHAPPSAEEKKS